MKNKLQHIAIIMDGNNRWAKENDLPKAAGHKKGAKAAKEVVKHVAELGIPYCTLFAFSSENWQRPKGEVSILMSLLRYYVKNEINYLHKNNVRLKVIGQVERLDDSLSKDITNAVELTKDNTALTLCLAFSYGGRNEIVDACQKILDSGAKMVDEELFASNLYDPEMPDVDMLIRPSGVSRISNFLLWQSAYAELFFIEKKWPDFTPQDIDLCIKEYNSRIRTFGRREDGEQDV